MEVLAELRAQGAVQAVAVERAPVTGDVSVELTGGHTPGHQIVRIDSQGEHAVMIGHLALSPIHLGLDECRNHMDGDAAIAQLRACFVGDPVLVGPLWPAPGAGHWNGRELRPVPS